MGWRNSYVKLDSKEDLELVEKFVDHHNNWTSYFSKEEVDKMVEDDEVPGEDLSFSILQNKNTNEYWAYLGNCGGMAWTFGWQERYFPGLKIYCSDDWPHYGDEDDDWAKWPMFTVQQYKNLMKTGIES